MSSSNEQLKKEFDELSELIEIDLYEADMVHGHGISFKSDVEGYDSNKLKQLTSAYNTSILKVCDEKEKMGMFHQSGVGYTPGFHYWEALGSDNSDETGLKLLDLIPEIKEVALKYYDEYSGFF